MQERWDLVVNYPAQLRSYVPVFTTYTDSAFPTDAPTDKGLRVALRYEVGRFFASLERLKQAATRMALDEAYVAYADMSLHFDRYLHVGGLYTYYDDLISTEPFFSGIKDDELIYSDPIKDPAEVRDLIVLCKGPDKGKTGIVLGIYPDGRNYCVVKLDRIKVQMHKASLDESLAFSIVLTFDFFYVFCLRRECGKLRLYLDLGQPSVLVNKILTTFFSFLVREYSVLKRHIFKEKD
jgi:hypothetical protein